MKWVFAFVCVLLLVIFWADHGEFQESDPSSKAEEIATITQQKSIEITVLHDAPFAQEFGRKELSTAEELQLIQLAFQDYLSVVKKPYRRPIGDNRDFVKMLTGANAYRIAPIPPQHPRINEKGELTDKRGTAFAIHPLAQDVIEVRAAGKDGVLWTKDDEINLTETGKDLIEKIEGR